MELNLSFQQEIKPVKISTFMTTGSNESGKERRRIAKIKDFFSQDILNANLKYKINDDLGPFIMK